uniref:Uncharacterized protein n=1 Tax=Knipowitschia caucasica TaxID=637954 RepID=A0AAV2JX57_KNICA
MSASLSVSLSHHLSTTTPTNHSLIPSQKLHAPESSASCNGCTCERGNRALSMLSLCSSYPPGNLSSITAGKDQISYSATPVRAVNAKSRNTSSSQFQAK